MKDQEFYKIEDICELFQVSKITVYRWLKAKKITGYKVGRAFLFKKADIDAFIESSKV
ncbi:MAG: helix-turn-helix domain-containing protein [Candidatus Nomurabacteria bacterium]|jgi:excisionase family DNA binding protein|nr:helix-turn-helix domain-containing protein [Candidatus Nomurabacteria bacterium]